MPSDYDALLAEPPVDQKSPYDALLPAQVDAAPIIPRSGAQMESLGAREFLATPESQVAGDIRGTGDQPVIPIPRIPQQEGVAAQLGAGAVNAAANLAETFETPQLIASLPVMPMKLTQLLFGGQALSDIKTAYEEAARPETTIQKGLELGGRALTDALFGVGMVHGAVGGLAEPRGLTPRQGGLTESLFGKQEVQPEQSQLLEKVNEGLAAGEQPPPAAETPTTVTFRAPSVEVKGRTFIGETHANAAENAQKAGFTVDDIWAENPDLNRWTDGVTRSDVQKGEFAKEPPPVSEGGAGTQALISKQDLGLKEPVSQASQRGQAATRPASSLEAFTPRADYTPDEWASESGWNKDAAVGLSQRLSEHPKFSQLKAAVDKAWARSQGKGEQLETDPRMLSQYLSTDIGNQGALQQSLAKDLGVKLERKTKNLFGGQNIEISLPEELKAPPVSEGGVEPSAPISKKSEVETPPTVSQTTPEGHATIDAGSKPVSETHSIDSFLQKYQTNPEHEAMGLVGDEDISRNELTDMVMSGDSKDLTTYLRELDIIGSKDTAEVHPLKRDDFGKMVSEFTIKRKPDTGAPPVASPVSESGLGLQAPVSKEAAPKIGSGVAPTGAGQPEPPSGVTALTPDSQPPEVGPNVKGFEKVYGPGEIKAGDSVTPEEIFRSGQADLASGKDPYAIADRARTGDVSPKEIGLLAAEHDRLLHEAAAAEGTPEYEAKYQQAKDFAQNMLKPAGTKWHQTGMGLQVKAPIDLSSLTGFRAAFEERFGKEMTPDQSNSFSQIAKDVARAKAEDAVELGRTAERVRQRFKGVKDISFEDAVKSLHDEIAKKLKDCNL